MRISEMWFENMDARNKAFAHGRGQGGRRRCGGALLFAQHVFVEEKVVIE